MNPMIKDGEVVCSSTVDLVTKLAIALAISDTEQTQVNYTIILLKIQTSQRILICFLEKEK